MYSCQPESLYTENERGFFQHHWHYVYDYLAERATVLTSDHLTLNTNVLGAY